MTDEGPFQFTNVSNPTVYVDTSNDPISHLEQQKNVIINRLCGSKEAFLGWLKTKDIQGITSLKLETLELLVDCWIAAVKYTRR